MQKAKTGIYADLGAEESRISRRKYHMLSASLETDVMPETGALLAQEMTEKIFTADAFSAKGYNGFRLMSLWRKCNCYIYYPNILAYSSIHASCSIKLYNCGNLLFHLYISESRSAVYKLVTRKWLVFIYLVPMF